MTQFITSFVFRFQILIALLLSSFPSFSQPYQLDYFRSPVDIPLRVSGTFAEFRYDHLHSGVDFPVPMRTPLHAVADGYIYRIRMQAGGFGRALYVNHPNGYTSVYAHIDAFSTELEKFLLEEQYRQNTFELDFYPDSSLFRVKKGEVIAFSGNSGMSQGPHLHFEIRRSADENPTNPLLFGLPVRDLLKPIIKLVRVYPVYSDGEPVPGKVASLIPMIKSGKTFRPKTQGIIKVPPYVIFGIQAQDLDGSGNRNGLYAMDVLLDSVSVYHTGMDHFSFDNFRAVNSLIDYSLYQKSGQFVQLTRIAPCNNLSFFRGDRNPGVFDFSDGKPHTISIRLSDIQENLTEIVFRVQCYDPQTLLTARTRKPSVAVFPCDQPNDFNREDLRFHLPVGTLFDTLELEYKKSEGKASYYSPVHYIHNGNTPLNDYCVLSVKALNLPPELVDKACLARVTAKGGISYAGGRYENGWVTTLIRKFGSFAVVVDRTPPFIQALANTKNKKRVVAPNQLKFKISDNFSGVASYCGYVNGNWVLMPYDFKRHTLVYQYDQALKPGKNVFELFVTDKVGNQSVYTREIIR